MSLTLLKLILGALATIGLYSVLYKETKIYRFFEHIFLGLAAGFTMVAVWKETLYELWWLKITGVEADGSSPLVQGHWAYILLLPIGLMGYTVFSKKNNWMSRIPIGIILGMWSGQQIQVWWNRYGPQIYGSMKPIIPTTWEQFSVPVTDGKTPEFAQAVAANIYPAQALNNLIFTITILSAMTYFFYSFETKSRFMMFTNKLGRWMLMIGFGAIFGSTVMARFSLVIDRMFYIFIEFLRDGLFRLSG